MNHDVAGWLIQLFMNLLYCWFAQDVSACWCTDVHISPSAVLLWCVTTKLMKLLIQQIAGLCWIGLRRSESLFQVSLVICMHDGVWLIIFFFIEHISSMNVFFVVIVIFVLFK